MAPADYPPVPWPSGEFDSGAEDEIISLINDLRASQGLSALAYDANLNACARIRCAEMAATDVFAHTRPDGRPWQTVLTENGIKYATAAENLAWREGGGVSASQLYKQWEASSGHYANMVRGNVKYVGVGVLVSDGQIWACTLFSA